MSPRYLHHPALRSVRLDPECGHWNALVDIPGFANAGLRAPSSGDAGVYPAILDPGDKGDDASALTSLDDLLKDPASVAAELLEWVHDYWMWQQNRPDLIFDLPRINSRRDLLDLLVVQWIHVHRADTGGSDFGIELEAPLDDEHWIGVRFRSGHALAVGPADTAFDRIDNVEWIVSQLGNGRTPRKRH